MSRRRANAHLTKAPAFAMMPPSLKQKDYPMPKYTLRVTFQPEIFDFDTDDLVEELEAAEIDINDPEAVADFCKDLLESGDDILGLDYPQPDIVKVEKVTK